MRKANFFDYFKVDFLRAFISWRWLVCILGVLIVFLCNSGTSSGLNAISKVVYMPYDNMLLVLIFMLAAEPYAGSFCEDMEYKYDVQIRLRGSLQPYVYSKIIVTFLSALLTVFIGFMLYVIYLFLAYGIPELEELYSSIVYNMAYYTFVENGKYVLYFVCVGVQLGSMAGVLSVLGLFFSLYIQNQILAIIAPVAYLYVADAVIIRLLGEIGSTISLYEMGINTLLFQDVHQMRGLYYLEILIYLIFISTLIYISMRMKRR